MVERLTYLCLIALVAGCGGDGPDRSPPVDLVRPTIGTGGRAWGAGNAFVGAVAPFGMVQVGPDTAGPDGASAFSNCSGYHADDDRVTGFSHTHLHGTGLPEGGAIGFMPVAGPMTGGRLHEAARLDRKSEVARPGYYAVTLADSGIRVELTATERAAYHRYGFPADAAPPGVLIDVGHALPLGRVEDGGVEVLPGEGRVEGWAHTTNQFSGAYGGLTVYFAARFDRPFASYGTLAGDTFADGVARQDGGAAGAYVAFAAGAPVEAQVGISYVDLDEARRNLETELPEWNFEGTRQAATDRWEAALGAVRFEGGTRAERVIMATALYHCFLMPSLMSDASGTYPGFDGAVHDAGEYAYYTSFSLWDTYRTLHPLLVLLQPERQRDMLESLVRMYEQGGYLPRWPMGTGYTNVMIGTPADVVIADSYLKGIRGFDVERAYEGILATADQATPDGSPYAGREGIADYLALGYVAADHQAASVSNTLEFAVADNAIANLAAALGRTEDAERFAERAQSYRSLWDPETQFFRGRNADGSWAADFDPLAPSILSGDYTEGDAWQYRWLVPHDPAGLAALFGSPEALRAALETFFAEGAAEQSAPPAPDENEVVLMLAPPRYYWHGNEPDLHAAYLFLAAGRPDLTQKWVRWIAATLYGTGPDGLAGNDDAGTLSAWYVFSALGFYPVPGTDRYLVGSPIFPRAEVALAGGTLVVEAPAASPENVYVRSVTLNGEPLAVPWFRHGDIAAGGTLRFELGREPSTWGAVAPEAFARAFRGQAQGTSNREHATGN